MSKRKVARLESQMRRMARERSQAFDITVRLLDQYPEFPVKHLAEFLEKSQWPGAVLRHRKNRSGRKVVRAVKAFIRHRLTDYDRMLRDGVNRSEARRKIRDEVMGYHYRWKGV